MQALTDKVDALFAEWDKPNTPGCAVAIIQDGTMIYKRGYGMANLEHDIPISSTCVFDIGSTSKQFTAMSVLLLAHEGKLSLDDDIRTYLPELPQYDQPITIRHLIHHRSGIRDYLWLMILAGLPLEHDYPEERLLSLIKRQKQLNFAPGEDFLYSNSGYFLLSEIIRVVTGTSLRVFADEHIFQPLGMQHTHYHDDWTMIVKQRAIGYSPKDDGGYRIDMYMLDVLGDGAVLTTVEDLYLWDQNFYANRLGGGGQALIEQMLTGGTVRRDEEPNYAFGLIVDTYKGLRTVYHDGAWAGYRAEMLRFPDEAFTVICLANGGNIESQRLARQIADIYLADAFRGYNVEHEQGEVEGCELSATEMEDKAGFYYSTVTTELWQLSLQNGKFVLGNGFITTPLVPLTSTHFRTTEIPVAIDLRFEKPDQTETWRMHVHPKGLHRPDVMDLLRAVPIPSERLGAYVGDYHSDELDVIYTITCQDGQLVLRHPTMGEIPLLPTVTNLFYGRPMTLQFIADDQQSIAAFDLSLGRTNGIRFVKRS